MGKIKNWYSSNKKIIWLIVFVIIIIKVANNIANSQNKIKEVSDVDNDYLSNSIIMESDKSAITGSEISEQQKDSLKILDEFQEYLTNKNIDKAYELLSENCKEVFYPTKEIFEENYYNKIFGEYTKKIVVENWIYNTYKVKYKEDAIITGVADDTNIIVDYITIIEDENYNIKLNINSYIGKENIDITKEIDGVKIKIIESDTYMDYQTFTFEIFNNSNKTILINDLDLSPEKIYIEDKNNIKYLAYTQEIAQSQLELETKMKKEITIKYYSKYQSEKKIKNVVFGKIILDYDQYLSLENKTYYKNYSEIKIEL